MLMLSPNNLLLFGSDIPDFVEYINSNLHVEFVSIQEVE